MYSSTGKKWRLFRAWAGGHPIWCAWQVTYRCNFRCKFCHYWCDPLGEADEPTVADYELGARKLAGFGTMMVSLAGGEPMLRTDLPQIVSAIGEYHFPFITTNGWFVTRGSARELMMAGLWGVSVSIDYSSAQKHDKRRGMQGAWEQAWNAVELFADARQDSHQRVNVIAVLMDDNIDEIEEVCAMAAERGVYFMVQPYGHLKANSKAFAHNNGQVSPRLLEIRSRWSNFLSNPNYLSRFDDFLNGGVPGCKAGRGFFNIDSTGDIAICVERKDQPAANLFRDSAGTIRDNLRRGSLGNSCTECWYNCRGEIENLYNIRGLISSLPTLFNDRGSPKLDNHRS